MALDQVARPVRPTGAATVGTLLAASLAVGVVALVTAPGVTRLDRYTDDTTFVTGSWWLAYALVPLAAVLLRRARASGPTYLAATGALVLPHLGVAAFVVVRYHQTGWAQGLEVFAFLHPLGLLLVAALVLGLTWGVGTVRRRPVSAATRGRPTDG